MKQNKAEDWKEKIKQDILFNIKQFHRADLGRMIGIKAIDLAISKTEEHFMKDVVEWQDRHDIAVAKTIFAELDKKKWRKNVGGLDVPFIEFDVDDYKEIKSKFLKGEKDGK